MGKQELQNIAQRIVSDGKGILAADESTGTLGKRFAKLGIESTEENRRRYREMLLTAEGAEEFIGGVILYDETIRQKTSDGMPFADYLTSKGIVPGIKVDTGAHALASSPDEKITEGLDGLRGRLQEYHGMGARFAKWRAVITIKGDELPSRYCLDVNAHALARYAALCQENGLVPIVEPEVLMDGGHSFERCYQVTCDTLHIVFDTLYSQRVEFEGILLKPNMVVSGTEHSRQAGIQEVAEATLSALRTSVPAAVPGIVFLSGGQSDEDATAHLNAMTKMGPQPWVLSFSYGRALQSAALNAWKGEPANFEAGQQAFYHRAKLNHAACRGEYTQEMERAA